MKAQLLAYGVGEKPTPITKNLRERTHEYEKDYDKYYEKENDHDDSSMIFLTAALGIQPVPAAWAVSDAGADAAPGAKGPTSSSSPMRFFGSPPPGMATMTVMRS